MKEFTKKILFQLNLLAALAILLAYAANHLNPATAWPIAFFGLAYPYILIVNIFFLVFWLWRGKKYALLSLLVILAGIGNVGRYFQMPLTKKTEITSSSIKLLTFNVRIFDNYNWYGNEVNRDTIIGYLNGQNADIICLQEFFVDSKNYKTSEAHTLNLFKPALNAHIQYTPRPEKTSRKFGVATFTKYPVVQRGSIDFDHSFNTCIFTDLVINKDTVRIYNLHLQSISLKKDYTLVDSLAYINSKRIGEVKDISKRLKTAFIQRSRQVKAVQQHINSSPYPVIICGDFNDTPVSYSYHQLLGNKKDAFREAGAGSSSTYRGNLPSYRIDYIFHDTFFTANTYSVPKVKLSDHYPVISTLQVNIPTE